MLILLFQVFLAQVLISVLRLDHAIYNELKHSSTECFFFFFFLPNVVALKDRFKTFFIFDKVHLSTKTKY